MVTITVPEAQIVEWIKQLDPAVQRDILRALIPTLDDYEALVTYGSERAREVAGRQGVDWDKLSEHERELLVDDVLHAQA